MKVLVYGATGSQQFPLISKLREKGFGVYAVTKSRSNTDKLSRAGAIPVIANMKDADELNSITKGMDAVSFLIPFFLAVPADGFVYAKNAINAAKTNNVQLFVWNSSSFILPHKTGNAALDVRIDVQQYLQQSGLPYIIIQPSVYAENLLGPWTRNYVIDKNKVAYPTPEDMPVGWIATDDMAALQAAAICSPHLAGENFRVSGLENVTGTQLAQKFSIALRRDMSYYAMPPKEFGQLLDQLYGEGAGKGAEAAYEQIKNAKPYPDLFSHSMKEVLQKLPVQMTTMVDWVRIHADAFARH